MTISLGMPTMPPTAPDGVGNLRARERFQQAARHDLKNSVQRHNLRMATHTIRDKRARVVGEIDDWQQLRDAGSAIKRDVMARMPELLEQFEEAVTARGGHVHWARDAKEAMRSSPVLLRRRVRRRSSRLSRWRRWRSASTTL